MRTITADEVKVGQTIRLTQSSSLGDYTATNIYEGAVTSVSDGDVWLGDCAGFSLAGFKTIELVEDAPRPMGSLWEDPETGALYVRMDDSEEEQYVAFAGDWQVRFLIPKSFVDQQIIDRLVPWTPDGVNDPPPACPPCRRQRPGRS